MYTRFFGLAQPPFSIAPDPRYLFMSERHREALAHLLYGLDGGGGFVLLTGEIGAGKTTVCRLFLEQMPANCNIAYIFNPKQTVIELLQSICDEFGVAVRRQSESGATVKDFIDPLNAFLLDAHAAHRNNVLIIDEAQNLSADVLEQLRLLTNLETNERKLLQIILIGQPELRNMLARPELEQLAQRVIARFHLAALSADETAHYIAHRLAVGGLAHASPFSARVMRRIHFLARGVPRRINLLCDRALLGAYAQGKQTVDLGTVNAAAREVFDANARSRTANVAWDRRFVAGAGLLAAMAAVTVLAFRSGRLPGDPVKAAAATTDARRPLLPVRPSMTTSLTSTTAPPIPDAARSRTSAAAPIAGGNAVSSPTPAPAADTPPLDATVRQWSTAIRRLGVLWHVTLEGADPCASGPVQGVYCFTSRNGLSDIRPLDRPGVLTLWDDTGGKYYALLLGLEGDTAQLQLGDRRETVTLAALAKRWRGGFTTLWRGPAGLNKPIVLGDRGEAVDWLTMRLATALGTAMPTPGAAFDVPQSARLREFQLRQGLLPDGRPGPQTLIRLASVVGDARPHLLAKTASGGASPGTAASVTAPTPSVSTGK